MPVLSDYTTILGHNDEVNVGEGQFPNGWETKFNTGGRRTNGDALFTFMMRGMTETNQHARVLVNGVEVGRLFNNKGDILGHWQTQIVPFPNNRLNDGDNVIRVSSVDKINPVGGDTRDNFILRSVFCFFKQEA